MFSTLILCSLAGLSQFAAVACLGRTKSATLRGGAPQAAEWLAVSCTFQIAAIAFLVVAYKLGAA